MAHKEIGYELIDKIMEHLSEDAILEQKTSDGWSQSERSNKE